MTSESEIETLVKRVREASGLVRAGGSNRFADELSAAADALSHLLADQQRLRQELDEASPHDRLLRDMALHAECDATAAELAEKLEAAEAKADALADENRTLRERVAAFERAPSEDYAMACLIGERAELQTQLAAAREALISFGTHDPACPASRRAGSACNCGFDAALSPSPSPPQEKT